METKRITLITQQIQQGNMSDVKQLCKTGIPAKLRYHIYTNIFQTKLHIKAFSDIRPLDKSLCEEYSSIETFQTVDTNVVHLITQNLISRYTITLSKRNYEQIYGIVAMLYSMNPFTYIDVFSSTQIKLKKTRKKIKKKNNQKKKRKKRKKKKKQKSK